MIQKVQDSHGRLHATPRLTARQPRLGYQVSGRNSRSMIDNLSLALTHGLMLLAAFLQLRRPDLDREQAAPPPDRKRRAPWGKRGA
ncbi:hypothetical protein [Sphingomonas sp. S2M10]|uniref:hypothetical protein n=1 Tax=Sphingomonas sp. S2M10 TaxID=2705010 RepID=UPI001457658C|nr:hypothetical protein [Sphingomonas sp. S2M10]